jgi:exocyst complex component 4
VFEGVDMLMEYLLLVNATYLKNMNQHGLAKMTRNILALQQNLKNIYVSPGEISMEKARQYYELYKHGATVS